MMIPQGSAMAAGPFGHGTYTVKRPFFTFLGREFRVYDPNGNQVLYVRHKVFSLKDRWSIFTDDTMQVPLVSIGARQIFGIDITTDVFDANTNQPIGAVRSKGLKSILRDTWEVLGPGDQVIGTFQEDSNALLRRLLPLLLGRWHMEVNGREVARVQQVFRFFTKEFTLQLVPGGVDPRFAIACALLALTREIMRER
ncbi:MAG: LURP-one-related family protein [Myxococcales bacterium]|nr:LURP-one-related family protein [Myxococcales bacterium]